MPTYFTSPNQWANTQICQTTNDSTTWNIWIDSSVTNTATNTLYTMQNTWATWVDGIETVVRTTGDAIRHVRPIQTPEDLERIAAVQKAANERIAEATRKREEAERRAEELLMENLSLKQREDFRAHRHFFVHGRDLRYRVRKGRMANVDVINRGGYISHRLCAHPGHVVPDYDTMLVQKLMLECEEGEFLQIANKHPALHSSEQVLEAIQ